MIGSRVTAEATSRGRQVTQATRSGSNDGLALDASDQSAVVKRLLVVGGAGSLLLPDETAVVDQGWFPAEVRPEALAQGELLDLLRNEGQDLEWSYLSPPGQIAPGERTDTYIEGLDHVVGDAIRAEDYAVALLDELDRSAHIGRRFTVAN